MMDLVERSAVLEALYSDSDEYVDGNTERDIYEGEKEIILSIPTAEAIPKLYLLELVARYGKEVPVFEALKAWAVESEFSRTAETLNPNCLE